ncbi:serine/threonine-protein phosphatase [filamentous cyanobacterium LEGE 11480]|uniref:Serine/threonine-protein phosphatase n=1 Tax=Romeriopsis navalis LEGE 11480 TaxID=2777977 RepID=A0A928Z4L4_9CYAN|nr:PP2C family serine/threonine-protein phosphatase [Romeriopsis navalis]MBE9030335.1 serine/threonine-protein phosphatase [Romeriopsis navalis LEGE 11480]
MAQSIYCPNPLCQAANPVEHRSCQTCKTAIPHHYLWLPNSRGIAGKQSGDLVDERYLILRSQVVLDTKPSNVPLFVEEIDNWAIRYAELFPYKAHIPQIYGYLNHENQLYGLLENNAVYQSDATLSNGTAIAGRLMPDIASCWNTANLERQVAWISQIFSLWQPLGLLGLTETLLKPELIRVDGENVRFLNLESDQTANPSLADFAVLWGDLLDWGNSTFWSGIANEMIQGQIVNSDQVLSLLDQEMRMIHLSSGSSTFNVDIATLTDRGPSRTENQDACYPASNTYSQLKAGDRPWLVVCDGVGGHEGGSLASKLAISTIERYLDSVDLETCLSDDVEIAMEKAILAANDVICERNDRESREAKQRMGTTVVIAYIRHNQLFLSHVGDSRAYRITNSGCYQITVDDDLASREAIYGSAFYREALQYPGTGALTQALGMSASTQLQPTSQRFWLTESSVFLLCSDGLSDFDLVDRIWAAEIRPVLHDRAQLKLACQRLVAIANAQNGHDNVTVGLLHIMRPEPTVASQPNNPTVAVAADQPANGNAVKLPATRVATISPNRANWLKVSLLSCLLLGLIGGGSFIWWRGQQQAASTQPVATPVPTATSLATVDAETLQQVNQILEVKPGPVALALLPQPPDPNNRELPIKTGDLAPGTIVQVKGQTITQNQENWLMLKVCSVPFGPTAEPTTVLSVAAEGWQQLQRVATQVTLPATLLPAQLGNCDPAGTIPPAPAPVPVAPGIPSPLPVSPNQAQ